MPTDRPKFVTEEHLIFLDNLSESVTGNMYGLRSYVNHVFPELSEKEAGKVLAYWICAHSASDKKRIGLVQRIACVVGVKARANSFYPQYSRGVRFNVSVLTKYTKAGRDKCIDRNIWLVRCIDLPHIILARIVYIVCRLLGEKVFELNQV